MKHQKWNTRILAVSTILQKEEQFAVDAAGSGVYLAHHRVSAREVRSDIQHRQAQAILFSVRYCRNHDWYNLTRVIQETPHVPAIALFTGTIPGIAETLLYLGRNGVNDAVDVSNSDGWLRLRRLLSDRCADEVETELLSRIDACADDMTEECKIFFRTLLQLSRVVSSVRELSETLHVLPSTLMSRFFRAGLPAPKRYLAWTRLARAAYLFENPGFSIANVANHLEFSSPQSFGRHIRAMAGTTALQFRRAADSQAVVSRFIDELILPYRHIFRTFNPLTLQGPGRDRNTRPPTDPL